MTGLGTAARAMSKTCFGGHCETHMNMTVEENQPDHTQERTAKSIPLGSDAMAQDECNSFLCNVLALTVPSFKVIFERSEIVLAWQVSRLTALEEPGSPERPPNS
jgi:hypothetical protein